MLNTGMVRYNPLSELATPPANGTNESQADNLCRHATFLFESGDITGSLEALSKALSLTSSDKAGIFYAAAVCFARLGRFDDALKSLELDLQSYTPHRRALRLREDILQWRQRNEPQSEGITLFTIPKSFMGHTAIIQRNAIQSWLQLQPQPEIILFGNEEGVDEIALESGLRHVPKIAVNEYGTPLINFIFEKAQHLANNSILAYVNTDIILTNSINDAAQILNSQECFLAVGRRWDLDVTRSIDFTISDWCEQLMQNEGKQALLHGSTGIDYFMFRKGLYQSLPPFTVGRTVWDNWLIWEARRRGARIIDATHAITAFHQEHSYTHAKGGVKQVWSGDEARRNADLAQGNVLTIRNADFCIEDTEVVPIHEGYLRPEPKMQDYIDMKFRQSVAAYHLGEYVSALDLLNYMEISTDGCCLPQDFSHHKANVLNALGRREEAAALLQELPIQISSDRQSRITFINTYYPGFLNGLYAKKPFLAGSSYQKQKEALQSEFFGDSDFYSRGVAAYGWAADDLIINCSQLQQAWSREQGLDGSGMALVVEQIKRSKPDCIYLQDIGLGTKEFIAAVRPHTGLIAGQIAYPLSGDTDLQGFDIIFSSFPHFVERFRAIGIAAFYQPLAFEPRVLKSLTRFAYGTRPIDCSFVGGISPHHGKGYQLLEYLAEHTPMHFWGYGAETLPADSAIRKSHHGEVWGKEMFYLLGASKITINRHIDVAENYANNMRLFEATGTGALLITDDKDNLHELFEVGKEVVVYRSPEECTELVRYYLAHPDEAEAIALAGQTRTLRDHTYALRMKKTSEILSRFLRYRRESGSLELPAAISDSYQPLREGQVTSAMKTGWKDPAIPARQRALTQQQLAQMYHGDVALPFRILADLIRPVVSRNSTLLEIGCASGYYYEVLEYLLNKQIAYTGVDYSQTMIDMARDYYPDASFQTADGASLPFQDKSFHLVVSGSVLLHTTDYVRHIAETARVAQSWIAVHRTPICRNAPTSFFSKKAYGVETVELRFNEQELLDHFAQQGFKVSQVIVYVESPENDYYEASYLLERAASP